MPSAGAGSPTARWPAIPSVARRHSWWSWTTPGLSGIPTTHPRSWSCRGQVGTWAARARSGDGLRAAGSRVAGTCRSVARIGGCVGWRGAPRGLQGECLLAVGMSWCGGSDGRRRRRRLDPRRRKTLEKCRRYLSQWGVDAASRNPGVWPVGLGMAGWWRHHVPVGGAVVDVVQDPDPVGQPGRGHVQVPAAGAGEHPRPSDGSVGVVGEKPLQALAPFRAVDVDHVEADSAAQADVGVWPASPPFADLIEVGGGVVDAAAARALGDPRELARQWQHRDTTPRVLHRPVGKAPRGVSHRAHRIRGGSLVHSWARDEPTGRRGQCEDLIPGEV